MPNTSSSGSYPHHHLQHQQHQQVHLPHHHQLGASGLVYTNQSNVLNSNNPDACSLFDPVSSRLPLSLGGNQSCSASISSLPTTPPGQLLFAGTLTSRPTASSQSPSSSTVNATSVSSSQPHQTSIFPPGSLNAAAAASSMMINTPSHLPPPPPPPPLQTSGQPHPAIAYVAGLAQPEALLHAHTSPSSPDIFFWSPTGIQTCELGPLVCLWTWHS
ncbi:unnamed protein product [Protopolystoma xenopodis]|uniref:Uncharacterized protein n=1 Tax=Protopolystoma xenopodis TaxID=117903 RepID=A0A448WN74_9PLAT|nr:unnamed protein product [Protopolystoma xenopodis]